MSQTDLDEAVEEIVDEDPLDHPWTVAWTHEGDGVICVKVNANAELVEVEGLVEAMAERGFRLGYAPGAGATVAEFQFKRQE